jgi:threonylcarbamoyladenosine tRNA methylthiotransferase MtaB
MRRKYDSGQFRRFLENAAARVPGLGLGTDIMVGFPGEGEEAFENSCDLMRSLPFTNIHVFSFSARKRTSAWNMADKVPANVIRERSAAMHRIADMKKAEFYGAQEGRTLRVLFEERDAGGRWIGFTDNYVKAAVESPSDLSNRLLPARMTGVSHTGKTGSGASLLATGELLGP